MKLRKLWWSLILFLSPIAAFAADGHAPGYADGNPVSRFLPASDYSLGYLKDMFGSMGHGANAMIQSNAVGSFGGFIMGDLFRVLNSTMLVFGVIMLIYMVFTATLKTAHEGEVMGREWSSPWIMLRSAMAMALLVPQASGYCLAQKVVMYIVLMGVAGANAMWYTAVDKMISEDTIKAVASQQSTIDQSQVLNVVEAMYQQQACSWALRKKHGNHEVKVYGPFLTKKNIVPGLTYDTAQYSVMSQTQYGTYQCKRTDENGYCTSWQPASGGYTQEYNAPSGGTGVPVDSLPPDVKRSSVLKPLCGGTSWVIPFDKQKTADGKTTLTQNNDIQLMISTGVRNMYRQLNYAGRKFQDQINAAGEYQCSVDNNSKSSVNNSETAKTYGCFIGAMETYVDLVKQVRQYNQDNQRNLKSEKLGDIQITATTEDKSCPDGAANCDQESTHAVNLATAAKNLREVLKRQGWANAGSYFYNIAELSSIGAMNMSSLGFKIEPAYYVFNKKDNKDMQKKQTGINQYMDHSFSQLNRYYGSGAANDLVTKQEQQDVKRQAIMGKVKQVTSGIKYDFGDESLAGHSKTIFDIMTFGIASLVHSWNAHLVNTITQQARSGASMAGVVNPIISLQNLGKTELQQVSSIWIKGLAAIEGITIGAAAVAAIPFVGGAGVAISEGVNSMISWLSAIMTPAALSLFASGAMLSVWLPFMPYILSILCVFGWILSVIEMMVAAPIVAVGLLSPEGQGVFGKSVPAIMLSLGMFLRPILMVFGFIAAIVMIFIVSKIVNAGFLHMVSAVFHNKLDLLASITLIGLYSLVMTNLCSKSFGMMTQISDRVLRWVGGHNATFEQGETQMLGEMKSGLGQDAGKVGEGMSGLSKNPQKGMSEQGKQYQRGKGKAKETDMTKSKSIGGKTK